MRSPIPTTQTDSSASAGDADVPRREPRRTFASPHAAALVAALRSFDPVRSAIDVAVRRFVRAEREVGRTLDEVLDEIRTVLRLHVEPTQAPDRAAALHKAAQWFAVSEYHRAD